MNTIVCFVFLLAFGLSLQSTEFQIDFDRMLSTNPLPNGKPNETLLSCPENCEDAEGKCQCVDFSSCMEVDVCDCLEKINFTRTNRRRVCFRLKKLPDLRNVTDWQTPKSPRVLLDAIQTNYQKSMAKPKLG